MKKPLYSIFDGVAGFFCPVFIAENDQHAIRMMMQSIDLNYRKDFSLHQLGDFDSDTGQIFSTDGRLVINGLSLQEPKP